MSGLFLVASFAPFSCPTVGWIALVPAWWVVTRSEQVRRQPIRHGYLIGLIYFGGTFWWISDVTAIGTFFLVLYLALYPGIWFLLVTMLVLRRLHGSLLQALAAASLWVMLEWWRSWFLTGFNWNELGDSQAPSLVFRQLAAFGGVPLISFVLVTVNILWAEGVLGIIATLRAKKVVRPSFPFAMALLIVAICFALGWHHLFRHRGETLRAGPTYACIQPNIPQIPGDGGPVFQKRMDDAVDIQTKLSLQAIAARPDLMIWPEATTDEGVFLDRNMNETVHGLCDRLRTYFLLGSMDYENHKLYNCAYLFGPGWDRSQYYQKTRLVIVGEFVPLANTFPWLRKLVGNVIDFTPGPGPKRFEMAQPAFTFAPLICFEDTLAVVTDQAARLKPDAFITITNDGWYQGWFAAWGVRQHLQHAVFRCVEHDLPMIRCANNGISCEIDQDGAVIDRFRDASGGEIDVGGIFTRQIEFYPAQATVHELLGEWIILISSLATAMLGVQFFCIRSREP